MNNISCKINHEQQQALELMLNGENVFLSGEAGTGKSFIIQEFREMTNENIVFVAPTGIAAFNVNGQTIHSFFHLKPGLLCEDTLSDIGSDRMISLLNSVRTIVIDEISMVRSDTFVAIDQRFRQAAYSSLKKKVPFAGKQVIVVGDFFQLPPIVTSKEEREYLESIGGIYPFQTQLWNEADFTPVLLKEVYRQGKDRIFMEILRNIRHGEYTVKNIKLPEFDHPVNSITALNSFCAGKSMEGREQAVCLCTTKREAERINSQQAGLLKTESHIFNAKVTNIFKDSDKMTSDILELKVGARVMTLANRRTPDGKFLYVNGDTGVIDEIYCDEDGLGTVIVSLDNGKMVTVERYKWVNYQYTIVQDRNTGRKIIKEEEAGSFEQIPLKLAYAITIHKSQGMGFDQVNIFLGNGCFTTGQLYTALSRCRTLEGLRVDRKILKEDVLCDSVVVEFYRNLEAETTI